MYEPWDAPARSGPTLLLLWELAMVLNGRESEAADRDSAVFILTLFLE